MNNYYELCALALTQREKRVFDDSFDWNDISDAAVVYSMTQIIFDGITRANLNPHTIPDYTAIREKSENDAMDQLHIEGQCRDIIKALTAAGVEFIPIGGFLTKLAYPSTQMRFLKEFEICLRSLDDADDALLSLGYTVKSAFADRKYFVKNDAITVTVIAEASAPEAEFSDVYGFSSVIRFDDCVSTHIFGEPVMIPTQEKALEYLIRYAAQAFLCGGLTPLEVWDILLFAHAFAPDKNKLFAPLKASGLHLFAAAVFSVGSEYFGEEFDDYFLCSDMITPSVTEAFIDDTLMGSVNWDVWNEHRPFFVPDKLRTGSAAARFFDVLTHRGTVQPFNLDKERKPLLYALAMI